jgi:hypothetical protein
MWGESYPAVSDYHIQKSRRRIIVMMQSGEETTGDMFLQPYGRYGGGTERPIDVLNSAEKFFPLSSENGETVLMAKDHVVTVNCETQDDEDDLAPAVSRQVTVEVRLIDGKEFEAKVRLEVPDDHPRLLDFLNLRRQHFMALQTGDGQILVNRRKIERVRSVDKR